MNYSRKIQDLTVNGIPTGSAKRDNIIWKQDEYYITALDQLSPSLQKKRAKKTARLANTEMLYNHLPYTAGIPFNEKMVNVFLLYSKKRIVGILVFALENRIWQSTWEQLQEGIGDEITGRPPMWTVEFIWVIEKHRRSGLAIKILKEATVYLKTSAEEIAWTPLSDQGESFAKKVCPAVVYLAANN